ncbi:MAG: class I SAM-dependent methyltransferase [Chloroflexota bacterium]|nr:class I SAM-dependent methyltransferase [Chloroflexota bacterium]
MIARHERVVLDLGTGDGRAVLRRARREPTTLVVGLDADAATLRDSSRRADRKPPKGGLPNALFLVGSAEELPGPLTGRVSLLTVVLPWGSLLRGVVAEHGAMICRLSETLAPDGELELLLSVRPADRLQSLPMLDASAIARMLAGYEQVGLLVAEARPATDRDVDRLSSSWARRLGVPTRRPAWLLRFRRFAEPVMGEGASVSADRRRRGGVTAKLMEKTG